MATDQEYTELGQSVCEMAYDLFCECDATDDFCVQCTGVYPVFGGGNRVKFTPKHGFVAERGYCTERFLELFDKWKDTQ